MLGKLPAEASQAAMSLGRPSKKLFPPVLRATWTSPPNVANGMATSDTGLVTKFHQWAAAVSVTPEFTRARAGQVDGSLASPENRPCR